MDWGPQEAELENEFSFRLFVKECLCVCVCVCVNHSVMSDFATPWTVAHKAPLSMEFSRQKYWSG